MEFKIPNKANSRIMKPDRKPNSIVPLLFGGIPEVSIVPPENADATMVDFETLDVTWDWTGDEANIDGFAIERQTNGAGAWTEITTVGAAARTFQDTGLTPDTIYGYRIRAFVTGPPSGYSSYSNIGAAATGELQIPGAISAVTPALGYRKIDVSWTDTSPYETGFEVQASDDAGVSWSTVCTVPANATSCVAEPLESGTSYLFRVRAIYGTYQSDWSATDSASTLVGVSIADSVSSVADLNGCRRLDISGTTLVAASNNSDSVVTVDISNPNALSILDVFTDASIDGPWDVKISGNFAYVASSIADKLVVVDISNPSAMALEAVSVGNYNVATLIEIVGTDLFLAYLNGLYSIDISTPSSPTTQDALGATIDNPRGSAVSAGYMYVTSPPSGDDWISVLDISDPLNVSEVAFLDTGSNTGPNDIVISGGYAFVPCYRSRTLITVDISDPLNPTIANSFAIPDIGNALPFCVALDGNFLYVGVAGSERDLVVLEVSNPLSPEVVDWLSGNSLPSPQDIIISGGYGYIAEASIDAVVSINLL